MVNDTIPKLLHLLDNNVENVQRRNHSLKQTPFVHKYPPINNLKNCDNLISIL